MMVRPVLLAAGALVMIAGCGSGGGAVEVEPPKPRAGDAGYCRELRDALPKRVDGEERRKVSPDSEFTAAWGDPAMVLRCGVPEPAVLRPESASYDPLADTVGVNGVQWTVEAVDGGHRYTTFKRKARVEFRVPLRGKTRDGRAVDSSSVDPLLDLARAVKQAVPGGR
jgi:hypothetical protein